MNYVGRLFCLNHKPQPLNFFAMFGAGCHDINPGGINAAVAQDVCQLGNVLFDSVESSGKLLPQIVGKYLAGIYPCRFT